MRTFLIQINFTKLELAFQALIYDFFSCGIINWNLALK